MDSVLQAWRVGGYKPSQGLLDTVADLEAGPYGHWIEIGLGRYRMSLRGPRDAVESSQPPGVSLTRWSVIFGAAMLCEPSRTAGRPDTDRIRRVVSRFLDHMAGREAEDDATAPPATAAAAPQFEPRPRRGRAKLVPPSPPPEEPEDDEPAGPAYH